MVTRELQGRMTKHISDGDVEGQQPGSPGPGTLLTTQASKEMSLSLCPWSTRQ
jgi:hypothetical protein